MVDVWFAVGSMVLLVMTAVLISIVQPVDDAEFEKAVELRRGFDVNTDPSPPPNNPRPPGNTGPPGRYTSPAPPPKKPDPPRIVIVCNGRIVQEYER